MFSEASEEKLVLFAKKLKEIRKKQKLSLRRLAQKCDIDYSDISKYETGKVNLTLLTVFELATALEIAPKDLFDF
jgi:transcriptional regulator with XRE-family HTH domain